ncbi:50S ribosomal protein L24e [Candidatus Nanohaloarchaea archaeon]|nr:50S ribosomal protein L24e [Candidatus Nanohaloarchaea archaeon]
MAECYYCGDEVPKGQGKMLILNSGERLHFCSGKCEKNYKNNRSHQYPDKEN